MSMPNKPQKEVNLTKSKEIIESYMFATSKRSFSIYSERLLLKIVELAQCQLAGANFRDGTDLGQVSINGLGDALVEIPIRSLLSGDNYTNYTQAKEAIMELMRSPSFIERPKIRGGKQVYGADGKPEYEMVGFQILNNCEVNVKPGVAVLSVNSRTWQSILDFSKGFRKFDLNAALKLKKSCSLRLFNLLSNQEYPITYSIAKLREMWSLEDKYSDNGDFIRRTIDPAKRELDEKAPWSFEYTKNYSDCAEENRGRRGKRAITSITFIPVRKLTAMSSSTLAKKVSTPMDYMDSETYNLLLYKFEFTVQGLKNNILSFEAAHRVGVDLNEFLRSIAPRALRASNIAGYVIKALNRHLEEQYNVSVSAKGFFSKKEMDNVDEQ